MPVGITWLRRVLIAVLATWLTLRVPFGGLLFAMWAIATDGAEE